jgi:hypothetical protein
MAVVGEGQRRSRVVQWAVRTAESPEKWASVRLSR